MNNRETNTNELLIRNQIETLRQVVDGIEKQIAVLASGLPKKPVSAQNIIIKLSNGKSIDALGREVSNGCK